MTDQAPLTWARLSAKRPERVKRDPDIPKKYIRLVDRALDLYDQKRSTGFYGEGANEARAKLHRKARDARRKVLELIEGLTREVEFPRGDIYEPDGVNDFGYVYSVLAYYPATQEFDVVESEGRTFRVKGHRREGGTMEWRLVEWPTHNVNGLEIKR